MPRLNSAMNLIAVETLLRIFATVSFTSDKSRLDTLGGNRFTMSR